MSWDDQQPPWGGKKQPGPEELVAALIRKIKEVFDPDLAKSGNGGNGRGSASRGGKENSGGGRLLVVILVLVAIALANASYFTIKPGEEGVVLRFGRMNRIAGPGLGFKIPMVDRVLKVDVKTVRKEEFGFRTRQAARRTLYAKKGFDAESLMLTADKNVIDVEWIVQYRIKDPVDYLFRVGDVAEAVRDLSEKVMRRIVGNMDFDYILGNRDILASSMSHELQKDLNAYRSGVDVVKVQLQDVNPPDAVKPAFNEVNEADQDMKRLVNEAEETYNREIPKASGTAKQRIQVAEGYAVERVNKAKGDTARFVALYKEYRQARDVTRKRMYLETMQKVLPRAKEIYVMDKDQRSILPLLNLNQSRPAGPAKSGRGK